jgi:parallel beta-helix repeat protein
MFILKLNNRMIKKSCTFTIISLLIVTSLIPSVFSEERMNSLSVNPIQKIWIVDNEGDGNFTSIKEALLDENVQNGDKIEVYSGNYTENINITKAVILDGKNKEFPPNGNDTGKPIITGIGIDFIFNISSDNVKITNFSFMNTGESPIHAENISWLNISHNHFSNTTDIEIYKSLNLKIYNNTFIDGKSYYGCIDIWESNYIKILRNVIENYEYGASLSDSHHNDFKRNNFFNLASGGLLCSFSNLNEFKYNNFTNCNQGIQIINGDNNFVNHNIFINCNVGIFLGDEHYTSITYNLIQGGGISENITGIWNVEGDCDIEYNVITDNAIGIWLGSPEGDEVRYNCIEDNIIGIQVQNSRRSATISYNNIIGNELKDMITATTVGWYPFNYWGRFIPFRGQIKKVLSLVFIFPPSFFEFPKDENGFIDPSSAPKL